MWKLLSAPILIMLGACGPGAEPSREPAQLEAASMHPLDALCLEKKFLPSLMYTGPDTPEDGPQLVQIVDSAICEIASMPDPRDEVAVRSRLARIIEEVNTFATEDRDQAYRYAVRAWRAAGFAGESGLFPVPDERILRWF